VRGRHADGRWADPFDPAKEQPFITEGTPWQYTFFVPHDVEGLISALGGRAAFEAKLDAFFAGGHHWHGNEPGHHIPFLYNHVAPWKAQQLVRQLLAEEYGSGPSGLRGNDDAGQMSAWYVFAALGLYPDCPAEPRYAIASPLFEEAILDLGGGKSFTIRAPGASAANRYIQAVTLNGARHDVPWLRHADVARGGTLEITLGPRPNLTWGAPGRE
jgi:predicted alpha-1,2-mannosidase